MIEPLPQNRGDDEPTGSEQPQYDTSTAAGRFMEHQQKALDRYRREKDEEDRRTQGS